MVGVVVGEEFNLEPSPRVLAMLGEISLDQWRCLAELIDNAVDGFLHAYRSGVPIAAPEVRVTLPSAGGPNAGVRIRDNGLGMTPDILEQAVRAGWTGNNPIDSLGLFGMGFNIATARLGTVTEVRTTRAGDPEWHGLIIDFDQFRRQGHFRTRHLVTPKADPGVHGTEVVIRNLKAEQVDWFVKPHNLSKVRTQLSQSYSAMLRESGEPIHFKLYVNDRLVPARSHCVWDEARGWESPDLGRVSAVQTIDRLLPSKRFCTHCMRWLSADETSCSTDLCHIVERPRRVRGWIGIQRYLHETEFGIDFIRNGRKIEIGNKDLFTWINEDSGQELEYPIDDPRNRGRFVGELHIDHCRVNYSKDRFDRADPAWSEMTHLIRGEGPLRPERAKELRYGPNGSPLYRLFKAFRRSTIKNKQGTGYCRLLLVADNELAREWAQRFYAGDAGFQSDAKWWELAEADDNRNLRFSGGPTGAPPPDDFVDHPGEGTPGAPPGPPLAVPLPPAPTPTPSPVPLPTRTRLADLSRKYEQARPLPDFTIEAFATSPEDPELGGNAWALRMMATSTRTYGFFVSLRHPVFQSVSFTPRDALLSEIAILTMDFMRDLPGAIPYAGLLGGLRQRFATDDDIDPQRLAQAARDVLTAMVRAAAAGLDVLDGRDGAALFAEFNSEEQTALLRAMAARGGVVNPSALIAGGQFLEFLSPDQVRDFFLRHPELFLDGRYWSDPYSEIDFGDGATTDLARSNVVGRYAGLLADAVWLIRQSAAMLAELPRDELVRAALSIRLLGPDIETD